MQFSQLIAASTAGRSHATLRLITARGWSLLLTGITFVIASSAQSIPTIPVGLAWQVKGTWHLDGQTKPVETGDAIIPGALLRPDSKSPAHSITILLPDGQRILYECFLEADCARDFRVPVLYRKPDPLAVAMMWRIQAALKESHDSMSRPDRQMELPRDEAVAILEEHNHGEVSGLVSALPNGEYTYTLRPLGHIDARPMPKKFEKKGSSIAFETPSPGLYNMVITDRLNTPRVDFLIAAVAPDQALIKSSLRDAKARLEDWNGEFQGWPIHDFQRAYLKSLLLHINPSKFSAGSTRQKRRESEVQEPVFMPHPGIFHGDTLVTLSCGTPGATIHFTVDGSQPLTSSPVYTAPIMVKGTALTIKAFATAHGKDQSAVVTGIFMIGN